MAGNELLCLEMLIFRSKCLELASSGWPQPSVYRALLATSGHLG